MKIVHKQKNISVWLKETGSTIVAQEYCHFRKQGVLVKCGDAVAYGTNVKRVVNVLISSLPERLSVSNDFTNWSWAPMIDFEEWVEDNDYEIIITFSENPISNCYEAEIIDIEKGQIEKTEKEAIVSLANRISAISSYPCFKIWDLL